MFAVLCQRNYALLWNGQFISMIGDWVLMSALPFYVYDRTGQALASSGVFIALILPNLLFGSLAGVFVDRWDRRRTMMVADLLRAAILLPLLLVRSRGEIWIVFAVAFAEASVSQFFGPAKSAILPHLVRSEDLGAANTLSTVNENLARLLGPSLGGLLIATRGLSSVGALDSVSYLFSCAMIWLIVVPKRREPDSPSAAAGTEPLPEPVVPPANAMDRQEQPSLRPSMTGLRRVLNELQAGFDIVLKDRLLTLIFVVSGLLMLSQGVLNALLVPFVKQVLHAGGKQLGWIMSVQGVGGLIGGILIGKWIRLISSQRLISIGAVMVSVLLFFMVNVPILPLVLVLVGIAGIPSVAYAVSEQTLLQQNVADEFRGRVFGTFGTTQSLLMLLGMGGGGLLTTWFSIVSILNLSCALFLLGGLIALQMPHHYPSSSEHRK
ncbi:MAG TPA: MFS transporter [Chthonomonadaceae bacterium]|nr:MFS transporter [Chthonomonadaceae bacterium]